MQRLLPGCPAAQCSVFASAPSQLSAWSRRPAVQVRSVAAAARSALRVVSAAGCPGAVSRGRRPVSALRAEGRDLRCAIVLEQITQRRRAGPAADLCSVPGLGAGPRCRLLTARPGSRHLHPPQLQGRDDPGDTGSASPRPFSLRPRRSGLGDTVQCAIVTVSVSELLTDRYHLSPLCDSAKMLSVPSVTCQMSYPRH